MACSRPKLYGIPFRRTWTFDSLHAAYRAEHPDVEISRTSVIRILGDADGHAHPEGGLRYGSFDSVEQLQTEVLGYIDHWNKRERKTYNWTFRGYPLAEPKLAG